MNSKSGSKDRRINHELSGLKMRRSPHIVMYFRRGRLIAENYLTRRTFRINTDSLVLLNFFSTWKTASDASRNFRDYSRDSISVSIQNLRDSGLLVTGDSDPDATKHALGAEWLWPIASRYYHFSTKIDEPHNTSAEIKRYYERYLKGKKQPSIYKNYPRRPKFRLLRGSVREVPFFSTLRKRRTARTFSGRPISFKELSTLVYYTWGRISSYNTREFGELLHRTSPSAGARHPIETYAIINGVSSMENGIYHYSVRDHSLELLREGDFKERCVALTAGHAWTRNASAIFIMTAVVARTAWKYRVARAYRAFLLDAGHLSQSFLLTATALGLAAFCIGVVSDDLIEQELNIDGVSETVIFVVGVGHHSRALIRKTILSSKATRSHAQEPLTM